MKIIKEGISGTMESSDVIVSIAPNEGKNIEIYLQSSVEKQYGEQIKKVITKILKELGINSAAVRVNDRGALDCTIKARTLAAAYRAVGVEHKYNWEELDRWTD